MNVAQGKADTCSGNLIGAMEPKKVAYYLRSKGWINAENLGRTDNPWGAVWVKDHADLLVPNDRTLSDYERRIQDFFHSLEEIEERPLTAIISDIQESNSDVIRVAARHPRHNTGLIPFESGVMFVDGMWKLMDAAASTTEVRQAYFPGRRTTKVYEYLDKLELGQTEVGSYIVKVLSPVSPSLRKSESDDFEPGEEPFERRVSLNLVGALKALTSAMNTAATKGDFLPFSESVKSGVSGNLCEAITALGECVGSGSLDLSVSWAPNRYFKSLGASARFSISSSSIDVIKEAARLFREEYSSKEYELEGYVVNIKDDHAAVPQGQGKVTVAATVDGALRKVSMDLSGDDFKIAAKAIGDGRLVRCLGTINRRGRSYTLEDRKYFMVAE